MGITHISGNIYLDVNVFIYLLEGYPEFSKVLSDLMVYIDQGSVHAVTSELSLAEILVKPIKDRHLALQSLYENTIQTTSNLTVYPVSRDILIEAAKFRAKFINRENSIRLPDAIHLATAHLYQCKYFITNDAGLKNSPIDLQVLLLSEIKNSSLVLI